MKKILLVLSLCTVMFGCKLTSDSEIQNNTSNTEIKTNIVKYTKIALICNLTKVNPKYYDGWDGDCPGTDVDANNFANMCKAFNIPYIKLENSQCTASNIVKNWNTCISQLNPTNGLFIFYYSGHGGQQYSNGNEKDGLDETLCFWDGEFVDDNVWIMLNKQPKTTRCFMVTDCCNSGTNYQLPFMFNKSKSKKYARGQEPNMLHIGGCNDGESSYGSTRGGVLTLNLKAKLNKNSTYIQWFNSVKSSMSGSGQTPTFAETGISFKNNKIFQ